MIERNIWSGGVGHSHYTLRWSIHSLCPPLEWGGEKEDLAESRKDFDVASAQTSELVNPVFSRQTGFFECKHPFVDKPMVIYRARCSKHTFFKARVPNYILAASSYVLHAESFSNTPKSGKRKKTSTSGVLSLMRKWQRQGIKNDKQSKNTTK